MMNRTRSAAADIFYPTDRQQLKQLLSEAPAAAPEKTDLPAALILPHSALQFSAKHMRAGLSSIDASRLERIVLIAPLHREILEEDRGYSVFFPELLSLELPCGTTTFDEEAIEGILAAHSGYTKRAPWYHAEEPSIELTCAAISCILGTVPVIPMLFGGKKTSEAKLLGRILRELIDDRTLFVISSQFSGFTHERSCIEDAEQLIELLRTQQPNILEALREHRISCCAASICDALQRTGSCTGGWRITSGPETNPVTATGKTVSIGSAVTSLRRNDGGDHARD